MSREAHPKLWVGFANVESTAAARPRFFDILLRCHIDTSEYEAKITSVTSNQPASKVQTMSNKAQRWSCKCCSEATEHKTEPTDPPLELLTHYGVKRTRYCLECGSKNYMAEVSFEDWTKLLEEQKRSSERFSENIQLRDQTRQLQALIEELRPENERLTAFAREVGRLQAELLLPPGMRDSTE